MRFSEVGDRRQAFLTNEVNGAPSVAAEQAKFRHAALFGCSTSQITIWQPALACKQPPMPTPFDVFCTHRGLEGDIINLRGLQALLNLWNHSQKGCP